MQKRAPAHCLPTETAFIACGRPTEQALGDPTSGNPDPGLQTLTRWPQHAGIAPASSRSAKTCCNEQGTIYASLLRLQQRRWIAASWGTSDNNRKAKFYTITRAGRKQLVTQAENWERISAVMMRMLRLAPR